MVSSGGEGEEADIVVCVIVCAVDLLFFRDVGVNFSECALRSLSAARRVTTRHVERMSCDVW